MKLIDLLVKELPKLGGWPRKVTSIGQDCDRELMFYGRGKPRTGIILDELAIDHRKCGDSDKGVTRNEYEAALAKNDGWIEWGGGECPVETGVLVDVRFRDGDDDRNIEANHLLWNHEKWSADIIAYRLHRPDINSRANDDRLEQDLNECIGASEAHEWNGDGFPPVGCECEIYNRSEWFAVKIKFIGDKWIVAEPLEGMNEDCCENQLHGEDCYSIADKPHAFRPLRTEAEKAREKLAASLHIAAGASPIELNGIGDLYFKLADAIISGGVFGTTFKAGK